MILKDKIDPGKRSFIRVVVFIVLVLFSTGMYSQPLQELTVSGQVKLPGQLSEISGMVYYKGIVYAINDSWNQAEIYALEFGSFEIKEVFKLDNVVNRDWEEITIYNEKLSCSLYIKKQSGVYFFLVLQLSLASVYFQRKS